MGRFGRLHRRLDQYGLPQHRLCASVDALVDNGGPAGVIYELLVACFYYAFIAASIAEVRP